MSFISIHFHRSYQSGARVSMLILPLREKVTWQHKHRSNFETSYCSLIRRALGYQWFCKHHFVKIQKKTEKGKRRVERLAGLGSYIIRFEAS